MYCRACGAAVIGDARFCQKCGQAVDQQYPSVQEPRTVRTNAISSGGSAYAGSTSRSDDRRWGSNWRTVARSAGSAVVIGFLLPWITVSCGATSSGGLTFSGLELAAGPTINTGFGVQHLAASPDLWLILLSALIAIVCAHTIATRKTAAIAVLLVGVLSLLDTFIIWQDNAAQRSPFVRISLDSGFWLSMIGLLAVVGSGIAGLTNRPDSRNGSEQ